MGLHGSFFNCENVAARLALARMARMGAGREQARKGRLDGMGWTG